MISCSAGAFSRGEMVGCEHRVSTGVGPHAHQFFAATSFMTSISRSRSATSFLEPRILLFEPLQPAHVVRRQPTKAFAPCVDGLLADPVPLRHRANLVPVRLPHD